MTRKPIFSPSALADFEKCLFRYKVFWEDLVELPGPIVPRMTLGTFIHAMQAAYELGNDPDTALKSEVSKHKRMPGYNIKQFPVLQQLADEAKLIFHGGSVQTSKKRVAVESYPHYRERLNIDGAPLETVAVEKTLIVDVGPLVIAPTVDLIVATDEGAWVVEHKSTERDDSNWQARWTMDGQTTLQILAAEKAYPDFEFIGVLLLPILLGRQRAKEGQSSESILGRSLVRVERPEPRWVPKNFIALRANVMAHLEDLALEYQERKVSNRWPTSGMYTWACDFCSLRGICSGKDDPRRLQPMLKTAHQQGLAAIRKGQKP